MNQLGNTLARWLDAAERRIVSPVLLEVYRNRTPGIVAGQRLLFLCNGNVCRSVLAAAQARRLLEGETASVDSAGLARAIGRPPPELALKVAADMGLDLAHHRSVLVSVDQIRRADCVFVMDRLTIWRTWRWFPEARPKLFLLDAPHEVPDPFGQPEHAFRRAFDQIRRSVERLAERRRVGR